MTKPTYIYDGKEVAMTGRKAVKESRSKVSELYEVKPIDVESNDPKFCSWVSLTQLYRVVDGDDE